MIGILGMCCGSEGTEMRSGGGCGGSCGCHGCSGARRYKKGVLVPHQGDRIDGLIFCGRTIGVVAQRYRLKWRHRR